MPKLLQLKVTLLGIEPEIWRRIVVPDSLTLLELHAVLQGAMGWQDYHLHSFQIKDKKYEVPETDDCGSEEGYADERKFVLKKALQGVSDFCYVYDFGDNWRHSIDVEDVSPSAPRRMQWPFCNEGENACPPEDCGGEYEYPEFIEALMNPSHPEHTERLDWSGGFNPADFSVAQATLLIHALCAIYRDRGLGFMD